MTDGCEKMSGRAPRASGGQTGDKTWEKDEKTKPERYNHSKVEDEAEERKAGGRAKKTGGAVAKKKGGAVAKKTGGALAPAPVAKKVGGPVAKQVGGVVGASAAPTASRAPRKSGGRSGSDGNPFSSARHGTDPKGHKTVDVD